MSTGDQTVGMEADALGKVGNDIQSSAGVIKDQGKKVADNIVGKSHVGAAYGYEGGKIEEGLREIESWLNDWSKATQLTGEAIGQDVVNFSNVDNENASETQKAAS